MFKLQDRDFTTFPPGYFERLFTEIASVYRSQNEIIFVDTNENALVVRTQGFSVKVIVKVEGDEFTVIVSTLLTPVDDYSADLSALCSYYAVARLATVNIIIRVKEWPAIDEYCSHPTQLVSKPCPPVVYA